MPPKPSRNVRDELRGSRWCPWRPPAACASPVLTWRVGGQQRLDPAHELRRRDAVLGGHVDRVEPPGLVEAGPARSGGRRSASVSAAERCRPRRSVAMPVMREVPDGPVACDADRVADREVVLLARCRRRSRSRRRRRPSAPAVSVERVEARLVGVDAEAQALAVAAAESALPSRVDQLARCRVHRLPPRPATPGSARTRSQQRRRAPSGCVEDSSTTSLPLMTTSVPVVGAVEDVGERLLRSCR